MRISARGLGLTIAAIAMVAGGSMAGATTASAPSLPSAAADSQVQLIQHRRGGGGVRHSGGGHRGGVSGRNLAIGLGVLGAAAIIGGGAYASSGNGYSCGRLDRDCDRGSNWACRELNRRGC